MRRNFALKVLVAVVAALVVASCGDDEIAPADPSSSSVIPDAVFFNDTGNSEVVLFSGRATDNRVVDSVWISFDNGTTWKDAQIDPTPSVRDVLWSYYATSGDMPTTSTVIIRVADQDANETSSSPFTVRKDSGPATSDLTGFFSAAVAGEVLALSSGAGYAFGTAGSPITIPIGISLTVLGAGYDNSAPSSIATVLEAPVATAAIFDVSADLTLWNIRLVGSVNAVDIDGTDALVRVEDCLFEGQDAWALRAVDGDGQVELDFLSCIVDASASGSAFGGGLFLEEVLYEVSGSDFYRKNDGAEGAAVQVVGGSGTITESLFGENHLAIWASGGEPVITSCDILGGGAENSNGINLDGGPGTAEVRRNTIDGNSGYGLRVGGEMELILRRNAITNNGLSGVLIDSELSNVNLVKINLGAVNDQGRNLIDDNEHPDGNGAYETQVYVTQATNEGPTSIPANYNYWGYITLPDVDFSIVDDNDQGGGRATVAIGPFYTNPSEAGP